MKRIEAALGHRFDHYKAAVRVITMLDTECDDATAARFASLFDTVNALLPKM